MDVMTASAQDAEPEINATVEPDRRVIELKGVVSAETVTPIIQELQNAEPAERLLIWIRANGGGEIHQLVQLIQALGQTQANVELAIGRYAMSAAATLWLWFFLDPIPGDEGVGRVVSVDPLKPAVLLFHRPRWPLDATGHYYCFLEDFDDESVRENLRRKVEIFDDMFERILEVQGIGHVHAATLKHDGATYKHHLQFAREAYYGNNDYVISLNGVSV